MQFDLECARLDFRASQYFSIPLDEVQKIAAYPGSERVKSLAFFGDSLLNFTCSEFLFEKFPDEDACALSCWKQLLVSNDTLAEMVDSMFYGDISKINCRNLNLHSKGTILEAIIELSRRYSKDITFTKSRLMAMFRWMFDCINDYAGGLLTRIRETSVLFPDRSKEQSSDCCRGILQLDVLVSSALLQLQPSVIEALRTAKELRDFKELFAEKTALASANSAVDASMPIPHKSIPPNRQDEARWVIQRVIRPLSTQSKCTLDQRPRPVPPAVADVPRDAQICKSVSHVVLEVEDEFEVGATAPSGHAAAAAGQLDFNHSGLTMMVRWRSKKKNWYEDAFHSCCGCAVSCHGVNFQARCPRTGWRRPDSFHPGTLRRDTSCRKGGGVGPRFCAMDHVPFCGEPEWSCCRRPARAEGCAGVVDGAACRAEPGTAGP